MKKLTLVFLSLLLSSVCYAQYITNYPVSLKTYNELAKLDADWGALQTQMGKDQMPITLIEMTKQNSIISHAVLTLLNIEFRHLDKGQMSNAAIAQIKTYVSKLIVNFAGQAEACDALAAGSADAKLQQHVKKFKAYLERTLKILPLIDTNLNENFQ